MSAFVLVTSVSSGVVAQAANRAGQRLDDGVAGSQRTAVPVEDEHPVGPPQRLRPVGHHDRGGARLLEPVEGRHEQRLALGVEVRVGLVEHDQARLAVEGPGEADPLPLAARQGRPAVLETGLVALRQAKDHFVHAGQLRRADDVHPLHRGRHAGDVLGHRAGEQHRLLRQVADVAAQRRLGVVREFRPIQTDRAAFGATTPVSRRQACSCRRPMGPRRRDIRRVRS